MPQAHHTTDGDAVPDAAVAPELAAAASALAEPATVVVTGPAGSGRTRLLQQVAAAFRGPVYNGGGLSMLRGNTGLALTRAVRAKLPVHDIPLCAEAVRSRVRGGLLIVDDLQWCDPVTLAVLPHLAQVCRVVCALRTPHRLPDTATQPIFDTATVVDIAPLDDTAAAALVSRMAPGLAEPTVTTLVRRGGGNPLALTSLAKHAQQRPDAHAQPAQAAPDAVHALAEAIADLPRAARTALAALGLLGRDAGVGLLGQEGVAALREAGMITVDPDGMAAPVSPYTAEIAAGLLDSDARTALHRTLATLTPPLEAARHHSAAGDVAAAYDTALSAADDSNHARRAEALLLAVTLDDSRADEDVRLAAADAALAVGRPRAALKALSAAESTEAAVARAQAHLHAGHAAAAAETAQKLPDPAELPTALARGVDRVRLLTSLGEADADDVAAQIRARHGDKPDDPGLSAALAAYDAARRASGWTARLAAAAADSGRDGDSLAARWSAWLLVECLIADGRLLDAGRAAGAAASACTADHAYSWQTRFLAVQTWCRVLVGADLDAVTSASTTLLDHALPSVARGYASAAASLADADAGALRNARHRLRTAGPVPPGVAEVLRWVAGEAAWLDNQPSQASAPAGADPSLLSGLGRITANWAALDAGGDGLADPDGLPDPARKTLAAWRDAAVDADKAAEFASAAAAWRDVVLREQVRCLLAHGVYAADAPAAVPPLEEAERIADGAGLTVLAGRARQALRRRQVRRDQRGKRAGDALTAREQEVLAMVADGEPTRRVAGRLGITRETVETHIRAGMRKLGAKTRTEAAVRAAEMTDDRPQR